MEKNLTAAWISHAYEHEASKKNKKIESRERCELWLPTRKLNEIGINPIHMDHLPEAIHEKKKYRSKFSKML